MTSGTLITVAPTGAESAKADVPALPVTVEEVAATARDCQAGRRVGDPPAHPRRRDAADARPRRVREVVAAVRENTDLVVQLSSGGAVTDPFDARLAVLDAEPDAASLTLGTVNFGRDVFSNPWDLIVELHTQMQQRGIVPEYEVFDLGQLATLAPAARQARPAARRPRARRPGDGRARRDAGHRAGADRLPAVPARRAPRSPRPGSAGRRCR